MADVVREFSVSVATMSIMKLRNPKLQQHEIILL